MPAISLEHSGYKNDFAIWLRTTTMTSDFSVRGIRMYIKYAEADLDISHRERCI
jgi:hypothetical protein